MIKENFCTRGGGLNASHRASEPSHSVSTVNHGPLRDHVCDVFAHLTEHPEKAADSLHANLGERTSQQAPPRGGALPTP